MAVTPSAGVVWIFLRSHVNWERTIVCLLLFTITPWLVSVLKMHWLGPRIPFVGYRSIWEPRILRNFRFLTSAKSMLGEAHTKYPDTAFWFVRNDVDMIVLPNNVLEEVRALPPSVLSHTQALVQDFLGSYTGIDIILQTDLHYRTVQNHLTPNLAAMAIPVREELNVALAGELPKYTDAWKSVHPYRFILRTVARINARVFVGPRLCRNQEYLEISTEFTENVFKSIMFLRMFPNWTHRFLHPFLPTTWKNKTYLRKAKRLLKPEIQRIRDWHMQQESKPTSDEGTVLSWMMQGANAGEDDAGTLAHLMIVISLASIHTTQMHVLHFLFNLAAHPGYSVSLRNEIFEVGAGGWDKRSFTKLKKLDSFLKETQRLNPPSLISFRRRVEQTHTLSNGTKLPKGAHICVLTHHTQNDVTSSPEIFDPLRYEMQRKNPGEAHLHQFAMATRDSLHFGYGKFACPGRFFAGLEIKNILISLLMNYDFALREGQPRPANLNAYEYIFPDPKAEILMRKHVEGTFLPKDAGASNTERERINI